MIINMKFLMIIQARFLDDSDCKYHDIELRKIQVTGMGQRQQTQTYRVVCVIGRVKAQANTTKRVTQACQCIESSPFENKTATFIPT